jgi:hypothetical protein
MAIYVDAQPAWAQSNTLAVTCASFTPSAGTLLVACVSIGNGNGTTGLGSSVVTSSGGHTWTMLQRRQVSGQSTAEVWIADNSSASATTVTATSQVANQTDVGIQVIAYAGAANVAGQTGAKGGASNRQVTITTTQSGSQVVGAFGHFSPITCTALTGTTIFGQTQGSAGDTEMAWRATSLTGTPGSTTYGITNTNNAAMSCVAVEILAIPPIDVDEAEGTWSHTGTSETIAGVDTGAASGRALVILAASADSQQTISSPTGGSLSYTLEQSNVTSGYANTYIWTAIPSSDQTFSLGLTGSSNGNPWTANVLTWSGSTGIGASAKSNNTGAPSLDITTTADNSTIAVIVADWNAGSGASRTWRTVNGLTPTASNGMEKTYFTDGSNYTVYGCVYVSVGAAGTKTVGLSAPTGQKYSMIAVEVKGAAAGAVFMSQQPLVVQSVAVHRASNY